MRGGWIGLGGMGTPGEVREFVLGDAGVRAGQHTRRVTDWPLGDAPV